MRSFGRFLIRQGLLTRDQLERATQALVLTGGRLGTNLVELGYLDVEELDRHLADHLGLPAPAERWLKAPEPAALAAVPGDILQRHAIVPLAVHGQVLHLAMADPQDRRARDEVGFATGLRLESYVLSEAHVAALRERHLGIAAEPRLAALLPAPARERRPAPDDAGPQAEAEQREREVHGVVPLASGEELIDEGAFAELHQGWARSAPPPTSDAAGAPPAEEELLLEAALPPERGPLTPGEIVQLEERLATAPDRETIADCALRLAGAYACEAALFLVHRGVVQGYAAFGKALASRIGGICVPIDAPSVLAQVGSTGKGYRGAPPEGPIDARLFEALGRGRTGEVAVLPVRIGTRVSQLLYVDNGDGALGETSLGALSSLCRGISAAYEQLILARRRHYA